MPDNEGKPTRIGGFEILGRLGQGGMGTVYKARQVSMDRIVALKVLPPRLAKDKAFVERFVREARSAARLQHPNIVQGIDVGVAGGTYYFAMEFVDGPTVRAVLRSSGTLEEKRALEIVQGVAQALEHACKRGIIHRDIKPDNLMLDADGTVKLADLGLARSVEKPTTVTVEGSQLGTPYYMAPEQIRGLPDVDSRADIYALGATLFHLVTGQFPYDGPTASAIMTRHVTDPVPSARTANPGVSRACDELIARMMAKDPADRPQTPAELLSDIADALAGKVHLRPGPKPATRRPPVGGVSAPRVLPGKKAWPWLLAGGGLLVLALLLVFVLTRGGGPPKPPPADPAQIALQHADAWAKAHPKDLDGAIARYQAVVTGHRGTRPAAVAAGRAETLRKRKAAAARPRPQPGKQLAAAIAKLKSSVTALADKDRFGDALAAIDAFAAAHKEPEAVEAVGDLRDAVQERVEGRWGQLADAADAAAAGGDFAKARDALEPGASSGLATLKLGEIDRAEKTAEHVAKWDALKAQAAKLTEESKFDDALKLLDSAKAIPLDGIADRIADEVAAVQDARQAKLDAALAAYQPESDKVWAAFKEGDYAKADQLLAALAKRPEHKPAADLLAADQQAAQLLKGFWTAVEEGLKLKIGDFLAFGGAGGTITAVQGGQVTLKTPRGEATLPIHKLGTKQALRYALLKDDARSHLIKGVYLLAEQAELDAASQALASAGDLPHVAAYRDRLDALRLGADEHAARRAWERIQRAARGGLRSDAAVEQVRRLLAAFQRDHGGTKCARDTADQIAALRERVQAVSWSAPFGAVDRPVTETTPQVGHCGQVWQVAPSHPAGTRYRVRIQHAAPGDKGAFRIWAWADAKGDGVPDTRIGSSGLLRAKKAGDWSVWEFATAHTRVFVGNWFAPKTALYYQTAGAAYTGLSSTPYVARTLGAAPSERATGARFTSIQVQVKLPPKREAVDKGWVSLFDGKTLRGWRAAAKLAAGGDPGSGRCGEVHVAEGQLILDPGDPRTGVACARDTPRINYELELDAMRVDKGDALCTLQFPVGELSNAVIFGGWKKHVGIHRVDGRKWNDNPSTKEMTFESNRWYRIRLRVTRAAIQVWLDGEQLIDLSLVDHDVSGWDDYRALRPLGMCNWRGRSAFRNIRLRRLAPADERRGEGPKTTRSEPIAISVREPWPFSMKVRRGQRLHITATGRWRISPRSKWHGPGDKAFHLRGRLGDGEPFKIGADHTLEVAEDGVLHAGMNEGGTYANNSGGVTVVIETTE